MPGDEPRLRQVLANLLSNAAKHTPPGTLVTVAVTDPHQDNRPGGAGQAGLSQAGLSQAGVGQAGGSGGPAGSAELTVTDNGPGVPPGLQSRLFERFVRGNPTRSTGSSTGLGLAIVDAVTTAHGGRVTLRSQPGQTRFTVTLPT